MERLQAAGHEMVPFTVPMGEDEGYGSCSRMIEAGAGLGRNVGGVGG